MEKCPSGLWCRPRKSESPKRDRGFESPLLLFLILEFILRNNANKIKLLQNLTNLPLTNKYGNIKLC